MSGIEKRNITNQVIDYLREKIIDGVWKPGEKITSENVLTKELGVSRSSVRFAIQHLVAVGILESFQGKGTFVKSLPIRDIKSRLDKIYMNSNIEQLIEYRKIIEVASCKLAVKCITEDSLRKMEEYHNIMMEHKYDRDIFVANDMAFHKEILEATGNNMIVQSMSFATEEIEKQHNRYNTEVGVINAIKYHGEILKALKNRDGDDAAKLMTKHLDKLKNEYYTF